MFVAALFTIAKIWKQLKCPSVDEWIKQQWHISTKRIPLGGKKEGNFTLRDSMDESGERYAK